MVVLAGPIVNAVLHYGDFSARDATLTAETLAAFGIGLVFFSVYLYTLRSFYAMQDTRTPFLLNCIENGINIGFALALYPTFGVQGLALAWSIAYGISAVVSLFWLRRRLGSLEGRRSTRSSRSCVASVVLGGRRGAPPSARQARPRRSATRARPRRSSRVRSPSPPRPRCT